MNVVVTAAAIAVTALTAHTALNARLLRSAPTARVSSGLLSVLIPARDEESRIGACLDAVLASLGVELEVLVLDDGSRDRTADVVAGRARSDGRVRLLGGAALPDGWLGKPHACQQLADAAAGEVLVFLDADVIVEPDGLARAATLLHDSGLDLVSPYPRQVAITPAERLVQPLLQWSWLTFLPLRLAERVAADSVVAANGQLLVCRRTAYDRAGGHAAVRNAVIEDVELARAFKRAGARATVTNGTTIATCRMYEGWAEVRDGYSKSLWAATRTTGGAVVMAATLTWLYCLPVVTGIARLARGRPPGVAPVWGYTAAVAGRMIAAWTTSGRVGDAFAHPASIATLVGLLARSHRQRRAGRLAWKGRPLPP